MFGQWCECEFEFGLEFDCDWDGVVDDDEPPDPDEDDEFPLAALAIAAPPNAIAPTSKTAASTFCILVTINHLLRLFAALQSTGPPCENAVSCVRSS
jgi:hypothetical protein